MSILEERMLMHSLTHITSSPCSKLVSYCAPSSSTQHSSSFPSNMASRPTRLLSPISHACELALTRQLQVHLRFNFPTHGRSRKMAISFATRDNCMCLTTRQPD